MDERRKYLYAREVYGTACKLIIPMIENRESYGFNLEDACAEVISGSYPDMEIDEVLSIITSAMRYHGEGCLYEILSKEEKAS